LLIFNKKRVSNDLDNFKDGLNLNTSSFFSSLDPVYLKLQKKVLNKSKNIDNIEVS